MRPLFEARGMSVKLLGSCTTHRRLLLMPWHDLTFRTTGFVSQSLFLCCAGMKVMALCPKIDRQGFLTFFLYPFI